ncbi:hypothetical protein FGO68_gene12510 [Halteria grandinella]|uniref:Uncharacterized protein n=1 Tax=Halteria grandinella TaxID=5974 RepID=A0A8J8NJH9_HALGN|nr:hypothetical protein FGO68_gene12510 [Halteria grandinella]
MKQINSSRKNGWYYIVRRNEQVYNNGHEATMLTIKGILQNRLHSSLRVSTIMQEYINPPMMSWGGNGFNHLSQSLIVWNSVIYPSFILEQIAVMWQTSYQLALYL